MAAEQLKPPAYSDNPSVAYLAAQQGYNGAEYPTQGYNQAAQRDKTTLDVAQDYPSLSGYPHQPPSYQQTFSDATALPPPDYSNAANSTLATQQPAAGTHVNTGIRPKNYILLSIINLLACFFLLGTIALIFSLQVDTAWTSGRYEEARRNAKIAKIFNFIGIGIGTIIWSAIGIYVLVQIILYVRIVSDIIGLGMSLYVQPESNNYCECS